MFEGKTPQEAAVEVMDLSILDMESAIAAACRHFYERGLANTFDPQLTVRGGEAAAEFDGAAVHSPPTCISRMAERIAALEELLVTTRARWAEAQGKLGRVEDFLCKTTGERQGIEENLRALVAENAALREDKARLVQALEKAVDVYGKPGGPWNVPGEPGTWLAQARTALDAARKEAPGDEAQGD